MTEKDLPLPDGYLKLFEDLKVEENLRDRDHHPPTVGVLLGAGRNDNVVRYSLAGTTQPLAVADYPYDALPAAIRAALPTEAELAAVAGEALEKPRQRHRRRLSTEERITTLTLWRPPVRQHPLGPPSAAGRNAPAGSTTPRASPV